MVLLWGLDGDGKRGQRAGGGLPSLVSKAILDVLALPVTQVSRGQVWDHHRHLGLGRQGGEGESGDKAGVVLVLRGGIRGKE